MKTDKHKPLNTCKPLNTSEPGIADLGRLGALAFADVFEGIGNHDFGEILHALIAELARDS